MSWQQVKMSGLSGTVKSWNGAKGFGFIMCPTVQGDVMFGRDALPPDVKEVQGKFLEGRSIVFDGAQGADKGTIEGSHYRHNGPAMVSLHFSYSQTPVWDNRRGLDRLKP